MRLRLPQVVFNAGEFANAEEKFPEGRSDANELPSIQDSGIRASERKQFNLLSERRSDAKLP